MESDMKAALNELMEWWKENESAEEIEGEAMDKFRDIMARVSLKFYGRSSF